MTVTTTGRVVRGDRGWLPHGRPGAVLVVPGPGAIHALAGLANVCSNGWPLICVTGSGELGLGGFQESLPPAGREDSGRFPFPRRVLVPQCVIGVHIGRWCSVEAA